MKYNFEDSIGRLSPIVSKLIGKNIVEGFHNSGYQITSDEWTIIAYLYNSNANNQNELAEIIGKDKVAITRYITGLELMGYVEREIDMEDKRANNVKLTPEGRDLYRKLTQIVEKILDEAYEGLSKKELNTTIKVLKRIISNLT
ncbi:MAG: hypothetical protein Kow0068_25040 [Marinilabiliales bacterium]